MEGTEDFCACCGMPYANEFLIGDTCTPCLRANGGTVSHRRVSSPTRLMDAVTRRSNEAQAERRANGGQLSAATRDALLRAVQERNAAQTAEHHTSAAA